MLTLADILEALTGKRPTNAYYVITEAVIDSRQAIPGSLFVALPGDQVDGHDFVAEAFQQGANFALVDKDLSSSYSVVDLREGIQPGALEQLELPCCLLVADSLKAMQEIAYYWRRKLDVKVIGITGSVGKTTTKEMIAEIISRR